MPCYELENLKLVIRLGDITKEECEAIVCPANSFGYMRGGLAQAIRIAGGDSIEEEAIKKAPINVGDAVITSAGNLKARFVIHAPTMSLPVEMVTKENVKKAVRAALQCARNHGIASLAIPAMGTGTGWLTYKDAAEVELDEIIAFGVDPGSLKLIVIVAHSQEFLGSLLQRASELGLQPQGNGCPA